MSSPASWPTGGSRAAWRLVTRMTVLDFLRELGLQRWLLVPPWFAFLTSLFEYYVIIDPVRQERRLLTAWDLLPAFLVSRPAILWCFAFGFVLLAGDNLARARAHGTATPALIRAPSRALWWAARLGTTGLQAACFAGIGMVVIWLMGARKLPVTPHPSPAALGTDGAAALYPTWPDIPTPLFYLAVAAYIALALWLLGCLLAGVSLVFRQPFAPFLAGLGWILASLGFVGPLLEGPTWGLNLANVLSYSKHLRVGEGSMPLGTFLAGAAAMLGAIFVLGAWWLQEREV